MVGIPIGIPTISKLNLLWKVIQVILERRLEMCDQPMDTVRPRCTRVKPGKGVHSGNYYKLPQIGRMGAIEELS